MTDRSARSDGSCRRNTPSLAAEGSIAVSMRGEAPTTLSADIQPRPTILSRTGDASGQDVGHRTGHLSYRPAIGIAKRTIRVGRSTLQIEGVPPAQSKEGASDGSHAGIRGVTGRAGAMEQPLTGFSRRTAAFLHYVDHSPLRWLRQSQRNGARCIISMPVSDATGR